VLGPIWDSFYDWPYNVIGRWQERVTHWLYRNVPFWTGCESTAQALRARGIGSATVISYGIETAAVPQLKPKPLELPVRLVVVSRLAPNKRIDHAIRTAAELHQRSVPVHLTIIGRGEEEAKLRMLVDELKVRHICEFTGFLSEEDKNQATGDAHWLLHTSLREGWGLNVIEANAMGTPAVVYPVPGLVESTLHEETGLVSEQENPASLADCVIRLQDTPKEYQRFRIRAWERSKQYHWDKVLPQACDWLEAQARRNPGKSTVAVDH
jgi:glycosyltransferase involved in cell wall biosynthesis